MHRWAPEPTTSVHFGRRDESGREKKRPRPAVAAATWLCLLAGFLIPQATFAASAPSSPEGRPASFAQSPAATAERRADFAGETVSADARQVADWVVASGDNQGLSFLIVDKVNAKLFLFDARGLVRAASPILLGLGRGDDSPPGIGGRKLSTMTPAERITPAGRFVATRGENLSGQDIVWLDYDAAISLHRATDVKPGLTQKDRLARLASATPRDNRISHGCINVSVKFYDSFIRPTFSATDGIVYVLPETKSIGEVFHHLTSSEQVRLSASTTRRRG